MNKKHSLLSRGVFRLVRCLVRLFYGKTTVRMKQALPESHKIFVANHAQIHGPVVGELFMGKNCYMWCAGEIMNRQEFPSYALSVFWPCPSEKGRAFCRWLAHFLAPLAACLFTNARTVEVRRDYRIKTTFRDSMELLDRGCDLLIFPENDDPCNAIVNGFHRQFVDLAHRYYKKTGICLSFVPVYNAPKLRLTVIGEPLRYDPLAEKEGERERIVSYLTHEITRLAGELPLHEVVPFKPVGEGKASTNKENT